MTSYERIKEIAQSVGHFKVYAEGERPVIYTLLDDNMTQAYRGTYRETLAFLSGADYTRKLYDGI